MYNWKASYSFGVFSNYMKNYYIQSYNANWQKMAKFAKTKKGLLK